MSVAGGIAWRLFVSTAYTMSLTLFGRETLMSRFAEAVPRFQNARERPR